MEWESRDFCRFFQGKVLQLAKISKWENFNLRNLLALSKLASAKIDPWLCPRYPRGQAYKWLVHKVRHFIKLLKGYINVMIQRLKILQNYYLFDPIFYGPKCIKIWFKFLNAVKILRHAHALTNSHPLIWTWKNVIFFFNHFWENSSL